MIRWWWSIKNQVNNSEQKEAKPSGYWTIVSKFYIIIGTYIADFTLNITCSDIKLCNMKNYHIIKWFHLCWTWLWKLAHDNKSTRTYFLYVHHPCPSDPVAFPHTCQTKKETKVFKKMPFRCCIFISQYFLHVIFKFHHFMSGFKVLSNVWSRLWK